tara:strand:- start:328 stop:777 length:450 start_codon:yes stop_codon:yes gene_type:complete
MGRKKVEVRVKKEVFREICDRLIEGESLTKMCIDKHLPSWRSVLRHVQDSDEAWDQYQQARALQAEIMRDGLMDLVTSPLPSDPKMAMAEVGRRRLEADYTDKHIRQLQPRGVRNKVEDQTDTGGSITIQWGNGDQSQPQLIDGQIIDN